MSHPLVSAMVADARASGSSRWLRANCLACPDRASKVDQKRSFSFHCPTGFYHCKRCGLRGRAAHLSEMLGEGVRRDLDRLADDGARESTELPDGFYLLDGSEPAHSSRDGRAAREFLDRRGITEDRRRRYGIGAVLKPGGKFYGRVVIPLRAADGQLLGYIGRSWQKKHPLPYLYSTGLERGTMLFGGELAHRETDEPLVVVEGSMDAMFLDGRGDAAAVLGMPSGEQQVLLLEARRPVVFALDGDAWLEGWRVAEQLRMLSLCQGGSGRFSALRLPGGTDPDEIDPDYLFKAAREVAAQSH